MIHHKKSGGAEAPPPLMDRMVRRNQRRSCRTLWFDWLASASAETAIDWRGDSAWLFAASSFESARVRGDDPGCRTFIRFFEKSWPVCTIEKVAPQAPTRDRRRVP